MKNSVQYLFICLMLFFSSCSTFYERTPADVDNEILDKVFSFSAVEKTNTDSKAGIQAAIDIYLKSYFNKGNQRRAEFLQVKTLPNNAVFKIELDVDQKTSQMVYRIFHTPTAFQDQEASNSMKAFLDKLLSGYMTNKPASFFEMYYNAKAGDPIALDNFLKLRDNDLKDVHDTLYDQIKEAKVKRNALKMKRKVGLEALDKAPEGKQFRAMVAKGDRQGAANILKKYLPWEEMAAFEVQFWETYIDVITNPVPLDQRILIYRGLNDDFIHRAAVGAKELTEKEAILEGKAFIMSSVMVKNQGSWNRRLRSLEAMNGKFIGTVNGSEEYAQSARITTMFLNHSADPKGSPFISFSPKFSIAEAFGSTRVSSYLFDPRLLNFNYASSFDNEIEYLVPLTTFPDELIGIADKNLSDEGYNMNRQKYLDTKLEELIEKKFGAAKKNEILTKIKKNSYAFFQGQFPEMQKVAGKSPASGNLIFYKKFLTKDDPKPALSPKGELECKDLIALFWMAN